MDARIDYRREAIFGLVYFGLYFGYLFIYQEGEFLHWLTLVLLPFLLLYLYQKKRAPGTSVKESLASVGIRRGNLKRGLWWAVLLGFALSSVQLLLSRHQQEIWQLLRSGKALWLFPLVFVMMLFLAGFTEEWFFRGILQTRLVKLLKSKVWGVVLTAFLFGIYHLPYAYLNPNWPSHGDWGAAFASALGQGVPMGLILGAVYERTENNLLACILIHALFNSLPAMTMIKFG